MFWDPLSLSAILCLILFIGSRFWFLEPPTNCGVTTVCLGASFVFCLLSWGCLGLSLGFSSGVSFGFSVGVWDWGLTCWACWACWVSSFFTWATLASSSYSIKFAPTSIFWFSPAKMFVTTPEASAFISTYKLNENNFILVFFFFIYINFICLNFGNYFIGLNSVSDFYSRYEKYFIKFRILLLCILTIVASEIESPSLGNFMIFS